jgi:hypothetical protein
VAGLDDQPIHSIPVSSAAGHRVTQAGTAELTAWIKG